MALRIRDVLLATALLALLALSMPAPSEARPVNSPRAVVTATTVVHKPGARPLLGEPDQPSIPTGWTLWDWLRYIMTGKLPVISA
jgi:hypothetical protein